MMTAVARVETDRASRHLAELCKHASKMQRHLPRLGSNGAAGHSPPEVRHVEWSEADGLLSFGWGRCTLRASADALTLRIEAPDQESLRQLQDFIAHRVETIGSRDHLVVSWQREP